MATNTLASASVAVKNTTYLPLGDTNLDRALYLVMTGQAEIEESDPSRLVRSASGVEFEVPLSIVMKRTVEVQRIWSEEYFSKAGLLRRDKNKCAYCGGFGDTHDHILPKSRGGEDSWMNSVTACKKCNGKKDNRTPAEAGMTLLYSPYIPKREYYKSKNTNRRKKKKRRM